MGYKEYSNLLNKRVLIIKTHKPTYRKSQIIGRYGTILNTSSSEVGVLVDNIYNDASAHGYYWFKKDELKFLKNESEEFKMEGFKNVAIVNLVDDYNKKDYAFALYDEDFKLMEHRDTLAVVNARGNNNRVLGYVKDVMSVEDYFSISKNRGTTITAEVVGVVNMDGYIAREEEKERLKELAKKKAAIERELESEINKRKSVEYYEEMAKKYSDNPKLAELVEELKELGE